MDPGDLQQAADQMSGLQSRQFSELSDQVIYRHLAGQQVVGLYPLLHDNTCHLLAADFDNQHMFNKREIKLQDDGLYHPVRW